jgi:general secretion pathway protein D
MASGLALTLACGLHKAVAAYDQGRYDEALAEYQKELQKHPNNLEAMIGVRRSAPLAAEQHLVKAKDAQRHGQEDVENTEVATAVMLDPANAEAVAWMGRLQAAAERRQAHEEAEDSIDAERNRSDAKQVLPIDPRSLDGMDLNFTRKTSLKDILQQLSRNSGVNIVLHSSAAAQDPMISVDLRGLTFQQVLDTLMMQSDLFYKVTARNSIMVFRKTPQNLMEYENKLIRTFYLSNAEVDSVRLIFTALMPTLRVFTDKRLNAITVLARPNDLVVAQRIVSQLDKAKAEVMIYLELLEVSERSAESLGLLPVANLGATTGTYAAAVTMGNPGGLNNVSGALSLSSIRKSLQYVLPNLRLDMLKRSGKTKLLADPNVRVLSGETGEVNIGDKISTTQSQIGLPSTTTGAAGAAAAAGTSFPTAQTTFAYEEVGVSIKVKPRVHFNGDITIELESNIKTLAPDSEAGRPNIGQRVIKTTARLKDGETAIFGGLLKEEERKSLQGIWGISSIPVLSDLLGHHDNTDHNTDVILSIRAVVVRKPDLVESDFDAFDPDLAANKNKPFAPVAEAPAPAAPGLQFTVAPLTLEAAQGQAIRVTIRASGGKRLTSGRLSLSLDPKLTLKGLWAGDFLTEDKGTLDYDTGTDGNLNLNFKRETGTTDGGILAQLDLEATGPGSAPIRLQDGQYRLGSNPVKARLSGAVITVKDSGAKDNP